MTGLKGSTSRYVFTKLNSIMQRTYNIITIPRLDPPFVSRIATLVHARIIVLISSIRANKRVTVRVHITYTSATCKRRTGQTCLKKTSESIFPAPPWLVPRIHISPATRGLLSKSGLNLIKFDGWKMTRYLVTISGKNKYPQACNEIPNKHS